MAVWIKQKGRENEKEREKGMKIKSWPDGEISYRCAVENGWRS
jgi:hypothetical protein